MKKSTFLKFAVLFFAATIIQAQDIINPTSATTILTAEFGSSLINTINGSGLDTFPSLSASHSGTNPGTAFYATNDTGIIDFDLGGSYLVDGLSFWNANATGPPQTGVQDIIIYSSEDGVTYTPISGAPTSFTEAVTTSSNAEQFSFAEITASFIRFELISNYGSSAFIGFAEVAFSGIEAEVVENVINPVSATTTLSAQFGSSLDNTINGAGLDVFPTLSGTHGGTNPGNAFYATNNTGTIDFDLGGSFLVDGLTFWNTNAPGPGATGIQGVIISSSEDGTNFTPISGAPSTFAQVVTPSSAAEQFSFTEVTASFIRFDILSNHGDPGNLVAFAEVAFSGVETLGVTDSVLEESISLYPNPASDVIRINNTSNIGLEGITVYDMNGRIVIQHLVTDNSHNQTINVSELSSGVYMVQIYSNQVHTMKRVIKN
nr:discoidin domain-containing protein [uncultured Psychroserpens sp.]